MTSASGRSARLRLEAALVHGLGGGLRALPWKAAAVRPLE